MSMRGRKKGAIGEQTRACLLKVAAKEFADHGFYSTKISTIVQKAKVSQPTFYLYFDSKDAIFQELVEEFRSRLVILTEESRLTSGLEKKSLPAKIRQSLSAIFHFLSDNPHLTRIGFIVANDSHKIKSQFTELIYANLNAEQEDGYFRADIDMNFVAESLVGMIEHLTVTQLFTEMKDPATLASEIVDLFLYGLLPKVK